ncbi:MAG: glycosyltransferase family 4 protein [Planctomycetes bacterium]|nr:glycosyltransferase family 4 protein [Planctomycetota bacterium]
MRVALECHPLLDAKPSGIGRYARKLIEALVPAGRAHGHRFEVLYRWSQRRRRGAYNPPAGVGWRIIHHGRFFPLPPVAVVHGLQARTPEVKGVARVGSVMDLTPFTNPGKVPDEWLKLDREWIADAARHCHVLVAISQATKDDCVKVLGFPAERIVVTHLGVGHEYRPHAEAELEPVRQRLGLPRDYLLHVGDLNRRKNLPRLVEAYAARPELHALPLVLAGKDAPGADEVREAVARFALADKVRFLSYVPDADLAPLYAGARAVCYPSLYEGFGFPIVEAMLSGVPVMTSTVSSCPEVAGGHAALADPGDPAAIAEGIVRALAMPAAAREAARAHAQGFTWRRCAEQTLAAYELARRLSRA